MLKYLITPNTNRFYADGIKVSRPLEWNLLSRRAKEETAMIAWIQIILGLLIGGAGFHRIVENPLQGSCALFLAGFLFLTGFEKRLFGKPTQSGMESN